MIADKKSIDREALKAAGITDDEIDEYVGSFKHHGGRIGNPHTGDVARKMQSNGVPKASIARTLGLSINTVYAHTKISGKRKPPSNLVPDMPAYDGGDVWVENRNIDLLPRKTSDRRRKQGPRPQPENPPEVRDNRSRIEKATDIYFARLARGERVLLSECL